MPLYGEKKRTYDRAWMAARRSAWIKEHGPCARCNSWDDLEVDHIDPATKLYPPAALWGMSPLNPKRIAELAKCQVLCCDCHTAKTILENTRTVCVHGHDKTVSGRDTDGSCSECRRVKDRKRRRRNARSFNGRTTGPDPVNVGSTPALAAIDVVW